MRIFKLVKAEAAQSSACGKTGNDSLDFRMALF